MTVHITTVATAITIFLLGSAALAADGNPDGGTSKVPLSFNGGHDIARHDYGRPCALIAAALGVETEVFRKAFSGVTPAHGRGPTREEARRNKEAMMKVLAPHGVTNERLDEVANYYRYRPQDGELWPTRDAKGYAVVEGGKVTRVVVTEPGSGYNTPPVVSVEGMKGVRLKVTLALGKDLKTNGGVAEVVAEPSDG
jgi:hypothetical protein